MKYACHRSDVRRSGIAQAERRDLLADLLGSFETDDPPFVEPPFKCDYVSECTSTSANSSPKKLLEACVARGQWSQHCRSGHSRLTPGGGTYMQGYNTHLGKNVYVNFNAGIKIYTFNCF